MPPPASSIDFGEMLRHARERRGISLRQIAGTTKISVAVLEALEKNDIARLPGGIFTRAIIRSYATEVGLDPDQAVRAFVARFPAAGDGAHASSAADRTRDRNRQATVVLAGLVIVSLLATGLFLLVNRGGSAPARRVSAIVPTAGSGATRPVASSPAPPAPAPSSATRLSGPFEVTLAPTAQCWASLTVDGHPAFTGTLAAGQRRSARVEREVMLELASASACVVLIDGRPTRPLGRSGESVKVRIDRDSVREFLRP